MQFWKMGSISYRTFSLAFLTLRLERNVIAKIVQKNNSKLMKAFKLIFKLFNKGSIVCPPKFDEY